MDLTLIGRALRQNRALVAVGVVVAILAGVFAGYSVSSSGLEPRSPDLYRGSTTIMLTNPSLSIYAAQMGGSAVADPAAVPENANLASLAMVYAWVVSGDDVRTRTEAIVGPLEAGETLTAQRRTTQPTGTESFGSNAQLPIFDIVSNASDGDRAEEIVTAATDVFLDYVSAQQDAAGIPAAQRVDASVLRTASSTLEDGGSGPVSAALVALVVLFVVLLLVVYRTHAAQVRAGVGTGPTRRESLTAPVPEESPLERSQHNSWGRDVAKVAAGRSE